MQTALTLSRLSTVENSCSFIGSQYDDHKKELGETKTKLKDLQGTCDRLQERAKTLESEKTNIQSKLTDLEYRSMRDNLMFYGVPNQEHEDCEQVIKQVIGEQLGLVQAGNISFAVHTGSVCMYGGKCGQKWPNSTTIRNVKWSGPKHMNTLMI